MVYSASLSESPSTDTLLSYLPIAKKSQEFDIESNNVSESPDTEDLWRNLSLQQQTRKTEGRWSWMIYEMILTLLQLSSQLHLTLHWLQTTTKV